MQRTFRLDDVPFFFGADIDRLPSNAHAKFNEASGVLADMIWETGGFRFKKAKTDINQNNNSITNYFKCCQDVHAFNSAHVLPVKRDRQRMARFDCQSYLKLMFLLEPRTLALEMKHSYHTPYFDKSLTQDVTNFIEENICSTPSEIFNKLIDLKVPGSERTQHYQVYYRWQQANSRVWRLDDDQFVSAHQYLSTKPAVYDFHIFNSNNIRALAFYIRKAISLTKEACELVMDATYGTNSSGADLFAVLAEVDGAGVPLCYMFVEKQGISDNSRRTVDGDLTAIIIQFLAILKNFGFRPRFFGTDKDQSELNAASVIFPEAKRQICWWHLKCAIKKKLKDSKSTDVLSHYIPGQCAPYISDFEACWGSYPHRRSLYVEHDILKCSCPSKGREFFGRGRLETDTPALRDDVLRLIDKHFNLHPLISDSNGTLLSAEDIYTNCVGEMYRFCRTRDFFRLWAYLWSNWYRPQTWKLWARAANDTEIPVLRTTMIAESHWRVIKHDFLHRFNRPRIDMVIWVLDRFAIPRSITKLEYNLKGDFRLGRSAWRKAFKREFKKLQSKPVPKDKLEQYHTDPVKWTCGCPGFLLHRFLLCKHILACFNPVSDPCSFFWTVKRGRSPPFWQHEQLILLPEHQQMAHVPHEAEHHEDAVLSEVEDYLESRIDEDEDESEEVGDDDGSGDDGDDEDAAAEHTLTTRAVDAETTFRYLADLIGDQRGKGNREFVERAVNSMDKLLASGKDLVGDVERLRNQRTMPATWGGKHKHPATMFYK